MNVCSKFYLITMGTLTSFKSRRIFVKIGVGSILVRVGARVFTG